MSKGILDFTFFEHSHIELIYFCPLFQLTVGAYKLLKLCQNKVQVTILNRILINRYYPDIGDGISIFHNVPNWMNNFEIPARNFSLLIDLR